MESTAYRRSSAQLHSCTFLNFETGINAGDKAPQKPAASALAEAAGFEA
jgi:hypothetical protein